MSYNPLQSATRNAGPLLVVFFFLLLVAQIWDLPHDFRPDQFIAWPASHEEPCAHIPGFENILVVLKTGATEALDKLPVHFDTTLKCVPHYVVFSDYEERIAGQKVYDVLEDVSEDIKRSSPDFHLYNRVQEHGRESIQASELEHWATAANTPAGILDNPAWRLDKWKLMPLMEKSFSLRPEAQWYVFMEVDTFIIWTNLLEWLSRIDSTKPHYLGSEAQAGDSVLGHGAFIVSNPAIQMVSEQRETHVEYYNEYTASQSAGNCVLGKAMEDVGVPLTRAWPDLQSEPAQELAFRECQSACEGQQDCLQFSYSDHDCRMSTVIRPEVGTQSQNGDGEAKRSGWMIERIEAYLQNQ